MTQTSAIPECFLHSCQFYYTEMGMEGYYLTTNRFFQETFGFKEATFPTRKCIDAIHVEDRMLYQITCGLCTQQPGKPQTITLRTSSSALGFIDTRWEITYFAANEMNEAYFQGIGFNIGGETKAGQRAEAYTNKINANPESIQAILSNSVDIIILTDDHGLITFCSPNIEQEMGYKPHELLGKNGFNFIHPNDFETSIAAFALELNHSGGDKPIDIRWRRKDNTWLWAATKSRNLLSHPQVQGILINLNNIGLRKKAEDDLQNSEARYRRFFEYLPYPLFLVQQQTGAILNCNQNVLDKYGYSYTELLHMNFADLFVERADSNFINEWNSQARLVKHQTKKGDIIYIRLEQYNVEVDETGCLWVIGQDMTETYNQQQESRLVFDISNILMQGSSIHESVKGALQKLRKFTGWDLVELWVPSYDHSFIKNELSDYYNKHPQVNSIKSFIQESSNLDFSQNKYHRMAAYALRKIHWIEYLNIDDTLLRKRQAINTGFKSALVVPLLMEGQMVASVYLFSFNEKKRNPHAEELILTIGKLISTELKKRKHEMELEQFFKFSSDIMTITGIDGRFIKVNPAFEKFIGYADTEAIGLHPLHYIYEDDRGAVLEKLQELSRGVTVSYFENRVVTKKGDVKWVAWAASPIINEGMIIATHRDITEQKLIEEQLRQSNETYELAKKATANQVIWDIDLNTHEITWSKLFATLFGYSSLKEDATLGFWESHIHPHDRERVMESFNNFLQQANTPNWYCEYQFERVDGSFAYIIDRGYMFFDSHKKPVRLVGAMEDITERKELEAEMIMKERIKQKQIAQAAVNAQEKERADIGKDLHDNTSQMLTSTKLFLEIVKNKNPDELLDRSIKNINTIIAEVRNISRSLVPSSIEDLGLIASLGDLIDNLRATKLISVEFYPDSESESLINSNYKLTLYRIVQEQINNIVKHSFARNILIELFAEENKIHLLITDNGTGFDLNTVKKGQGLKNMQSRAELLNGTLEIIAAPGKGCKLKVTIPY